MVASDVDHAYATCLALARSHYENFPVASWLMPAAARPHVAAIYAFARIADDFADEGTAIESERLARLDGWQARLDHAAQGRVHPAGHQLHDAVFEALARTLTGPALGTGGVMAHASASICMAHGVRRRCGGGPITAVASAGTTTPCREHTGCRHIAVATNCDGNTKRRRHTMPQHIGCGRPRSP